MADDAAKLALSGAPAPAGDCARCAKSFQGLDVMGAGHHPRLRGTDRLRSRTLGKLRVCRRCGRLWIEHFDNREHYTWYADIGLTAVELLAADATPARIVTWAARESTERADWWLDQLLAAWLRRRPAWAAEALTAIQQALTARPVAIDRPGAGDAPRRRLALLRMAVSIFEAAAEGDNLPLPTPAAVARCCREHPAPPTDVLSYAGKTSTLMVLAARLATLSPPPARDGAPLTADGLGPLIAAGFGPPLPNEQRGATRGQQLRIGFEALWRIREIGGRWAGQNAAIAMPKAAWQALDEALDPAPHLAAEVAAVLAAPAADPNARRDAVQQLEAFGPILGDRGARLSPRALERLSALLTGLAASDAHPDRVAHRALQGSIRRFERLQASDCDARDGTCAEWVRVVTR